MRKIRTNSVSSDADLTALGAAMGLHVEVMAKDEIPAKFHGFGIINLESSELPGSHWTALYVPKKAKGDAFYFDSFGAPPVEWIDQITKARPLYWNDRVIQAFKSDACGYFSLAFLLWVKRNPTVEGAKAFVRQFATGTEEARLKNNQLLNKILNGF